MRVARTQKRPFEWSKSGDNGVIVAGMKSITPTISGLASSLFLNVGLTHLAEKLDTIAHHQIRSASGPSAPCVFPTMFRPRSRR